MKKNYLLILLFILISSLFACNDANNSNNNSFEEEENACNVIILCGQSNAEGHTKSNMLLNTDPYLYSKYSVSSSFESKVKIKYETNVLQVHNKSNGFVDIKLGMGKDYASYGPEIGMNEAFEEADLKRDLFIIKYTHGGTCLYTQWHSTSSPKGQGILYEGLLNAVSEAMYELEEMGYSPYLKGVCWMQGESDSTSDHPLYASNYREYENYFIEDLNEDLSHYKEDEDEKLKFIDAGISDSSPWYNYLLINASKKNNALQDPENRYYIDTISLGLDYSKEPTGGVDYYHYDSLAMIELGKEFAKALLSFGIL